MAYQYVKTEVSGHVAVVTYCNPPVNAMNAAAYREIAAVFQEVGQRRDVRCVVFRTEGKGFIGGNDVGEIAGHNRANHAAYQELVGRGVCAIQDCAVPVVAAVQGYAIGVGLIMAMVCDLVVASQRAWFNLPEISLGIPAGTSFMMTALPEKLVKYLTLTGERLTAQEMLAYGAVNFVVPPEELEAKAMALAEKIAAQPPRTVRDYKLWAKKCYNHQSAEKFEIETVYTGRLLETEEKEECLRAFYEKRPARFSDVP